MNSNSNIRKKHSSVSFGGLANKRKYGRKGSMYSLVSDDTQNIVKSNHNTLRKQISKSTTMLQYVSVGRNLFKLLEETINDDKADYQNPTVEILNDPCFTEEPHSSDDKIPYLPVFCSITNDNVDDIPREIIYRQLCIVDWFLEAMNQEPPSLNVNILKYWNVDNKDIDFLNIQFCKEIDQKWKLFLSQEHKELKNRTNSRNILQKFSKTFQKTNKFTDLLKKANLISQSSKDLNMPNKQYNLRKSFSGSDKNQNNGRNCEKFSKSSVVTATSKSTKKDSMLNKNKKLKNPLIELPSTKKSDLALLIKKKFEKVERENSLNLYSEFNKWDAIVCPSYDPYLFLRGPTESVIFNRFGYRIYKRISVVFQIDPSNVFDNFEKLRVLSCRINHIRTHYIDFNKAVEHMKRKSDLNEKISLASQSCETHEKWFLNLIKTLKKYSKDTRFESILECLNKYAKIGSQVNINIYRLDRIISLMPIWQLFMPDVISSFYFCSENIMNLPKKDIDETLNKKYIQFINQAE
ncbi:hypothetical protein A3Q56_02366 [Intoshia linei]|uniref:Uncharacterized protein n=1 Tax=Intoshia linei TaxID=1819745 RepID=A0A177B6J3_9BILA|nr:hypothetical protein A3Q56_02366 [Intoshia linei]